MFGINKKPDNPWVMCLYAPISGRLVVPPTPCDSGYGYRIEIRTPGLRGKTISIEGIHKDWLKDSGLGLIPIMNCQVFYLVMGPNGEQGKVMDNIGIGFIENDPKSIMEAKDELDLQKEFLKEKEVMLNRKEEKKLKEVAKSMEIIKRKEQPQQDKYGRPREPDSDSE